MPLRKWHKNAGKTENSVKLCRHANLIAIANILVVNSLTSRIITEKM
jgi:hypothetical protein